MKPLEPETPTPNALTASLFKLAREPLPRWMGGVRPEAAVLPPAIGTNKMG